MLEELRVLVGLGEQEELTRQQEKRGLVSWMFFFLEIALDQLGDSELALSGAEEFSHSFDLPSIEVEACNSFFFMIEVHSNWLIIV